MAQYKFFLLDAGGHVNGRLDVECMDDDHALEQAAAVLRGPAGLEVWQNGRMVGTAAPNIGNIP